MNHLNFSPVVLLILGIVPFLLMIVQWVTEDILGMGRVIDYMTRWEVVFQIGIEMFLLGVILWGLDWLKEFIRLRKWRREFISEWNKDYRELDEEEARLEHLRREADKLNRENFMREYLCYPPFDEDEQWRSNKNSTHTQWSKNVEDNGTMIINLFPTHSSGIFFGKDVCGIDTAGNLRTNNGTEF